METVKGGIRFTIENPRPDEFAQEKGDCSVRALKVAAGVPYVDAHAMLAKIGRRARKGVTGAQLLALTSLPHVYGYKVTSIGVPMFRRTLGSVMPMLRQGRYMIIKTGHAIGCVDGVLHDTGTSGPGSRVRMILKFTPTSEIEKQESVL